MQSPIASPHLKFGKRTRSPGARIICDNSGNNDCPMNDNNGQSHEGSPWQAMKRLRVAEEENAYKNNWGIAPSSSAISNSATPYDSSRTTSDSTIPYNVSKSHYQTQTSGQDTSSETSYHTGQRFSDEKCHPDDNIGVVNYENVNHILGALHEERLRREHLERSKRSAISSTRVSQQTYTSMQGDGTGTDTADFSSMGNRSQQSTLSRFPNSHPEQGKYTYSSSQIIPDQTQRLGQQEHLQNVHQYYRPSQPVAPRAYQPSSHEHSGQQERDYDSRQYQQELYNNHALWQQDEILHQQQRKHYEEQQHLHYQQQQQQLPGRYSQQWGGLSRLEFIPNATTGSPQRKRKVIHLHTSSKLG